MDDDSPLSYRTSSIESMDVKTAQQTDQKREKSQVSQNDSENRFFSQICESLSLEETEHESRIIARKLLINGRQELVHYRDSIAPTNFENQMGKEGNSTLLKILKRYFQQQWEQIPFDWFNTFITEQRSQDDDRHYQQVLTRTAEYGQKYMRECPVFSIVFQLVFIFNDDINMDKSKFDQVWNTFAMEGCKTALKKWNNYIVSAVMKEHIDSLNSPLFLALREYFREPVLSLLEQSNISSGRNLLEIALNCLANYGWIVGLNDVKVKELISPKNRTLLMDNLRKYLEKNVSPLPLVNSSSESSKMAENPVQKQSNKATTSSSRSKYGIIILGNSGVGKSFLANILLGREAFVHHVGARAVTTETQFEETSMGNENYAIFNVPGLIEADQKRIEMNKREIDKAFVERPTSVIVYVFGGQQSGRIKDEDVIAFNALNKAYPLNLKSLVLVVNGLPKNRPTDYEGETIVLLKELIEVPFQSICVLDMIDMDTQHERENLKNRLLQVIVERTANKHIKEHDIELQREEVRQAKEKIKILQATFEQNKEKYEKQIKEQQTKYDNMFAEIRKENEQMRRLIERQVEEQKQRDAAHKKAIQEANERATKLQAEKQAEQRAREQAEQRAKEQVEQRAWGQAEQRARKEAEQRAREKVERQAREQAQRAVVQLFAPPGKYKELYCKGRLCINCGKCRDWYYTGDLATWKWIQRVQNWKEDDWKRWDNGDFWKGFTRRTDGATCTHGGIGIGGIHLRLRLGFLDRIGLYLCLCNNNFRG